MHTIQISKIGFCYLRAVVATEATLGVGIRISIFLISAKPFSKECACFFIDKRKLLSETQLQTLPFDSLVTKHRDSCLRIQITVANYATGALTSLISLNEDPTNNMDATPTIAATGNPPSLKHLLAP